MELINKAVFQERISKLKRRDYICASISLLVLILSYQAESVALPIFTALLMGAYYYYEIYYKQPKGFFVAKDVRERHHRESLWEIKEILKHLLLLGPPPHDLKIFVSAAETIAFLLPRVCSQTHFESDDEWRRVLLLREEFYQLALTYAEQAGVRNSILESFQRVTRLANWMRDKYSTSGTDPVIAEGELHQLMSPIGDFRYWVEPARGGGEVVLPGIINLDASDFVRLNGKWFRIKIAEYFLHFNDKMQYQFALTHFNAHCIDDGKLYIVVGSNQVGWYLMEPASVKSHLGFHRSVKQTQVVEFDGIKFIKTLSSSFAGLGIDCWDAHGSIGEVVFAQNRNEGLALISYLPKSTVGRKAEFLAGYVINDFQFLSWGHGVIRDLSMNE